MGSQVDESRRTGHRGSLTRRPGQRKGAAIFWPVAESASEESTKIFRLPGIARAVLMVRQTTRGARPALRRIGRTRNMLQQGRRRRTRHMTGIAFLLNGTPVRVTGQSPTRTLLDWLREDRGLCGTKEGCNEGDCGACTVMVTDDRGQPGAERLHPVAAATAGQGGAHGRRHLRPRRRSCTRCKRRWSSHHGSQCGFCTPGFVVSMAAAHLNGATDHDDQLAGNLCRCTGYAPIIRAAKARRERPGAGLDERGCGLPLCANIPGGPGAGCPRRFLPSVVG